MAQRIINIGSSANKGDGDPIRTAFGKVNDNFTELYGKVTVLEDGTVAQVQDTKGSIFADDSTLLVDAINGIIPASVVSGTLNNNTVGTHTGDLVGSVFADDSTLLVDGVNGTIPYSVLSGTPTIPADVGDLTDTGNLLFDGAYSSLSGKPTGLVGSSIENTGTNSIDINGLKASGTGYVAATSYGTPNNQITLYYLKSEGNYAERSALAHFLNQLTNGDAFTFVYVNGSSTTVTVNATVDSITIDETWGNSSQTRIDIVCNENLSSQVPTTTEFPKVGATHTFSFSDTATLTLPVTTDTVLTANAPASIQGKTIDATKNDISNLQYNFSSIRSKYNPVFISTPEGTSAGGGTEIWSDTNDITDDVALNIMRLEVSGTPENKRAKLSSGKSSMLTGGGREGKIIVLYNNDATYTFTVDYQNFIRNDYSQNVVIQPYNCAVFMNAYGSWVLLGNG